MGALINERSQLGLQGTFHLPNRLFLPPYFSDFQATNLHRSDLHQEHTQHIGLKQQDTVSRVDPLIFFVKLGGYQNILLMFVFQVMFVYMLFWSNYSDLTRPISPKWWFISGKSMVLNPRQISEKKSRLVKYYEPFGQMYGIFT